MRLPLLLLALSLLGGGGAAHADDRETAREHFRKGQTHYALGEFEEAANEFKEAYRLRDEPAILFNIAQAMRLLGQLKPAVFYYKQYLGRKVDAPNRADVESTIDGLKLKIDEQEQDELSRKTAQAAANKRDGKVGPAAKPSSPAARSAAPKTLASASVQAATAVHEGTSVEADGLAARPTVPAGALAAPADGGGPKATRIAGYAALGAGVVAEGLAFIFHGSAQSASDELSRKYAAGTLQPSDSKLKSDVESKGRLATLSAVGGAALILAGAALVFVF